METAQLLAETGSQAGDIARTQGEIAGLKAQTDPVALAAAREELAGKGKLNPASDEIAKQAYNTAQKPFGTGSSLQQGISAATAAMQGLAGGNVAQALSGAASPYVAQKIHDLTEGNREAQAMAHAVLGAVTSYAAGNSALAGAAGGVSGELMAQLVMKQLYPGKAAGDLSETEKQTISALGTLAAGLAGGVIGDSTADAVSGAQAGQNAVNNNLFGGTEDGQEKFVREHGKDVMSCADDPSSASCQRGQAMKDALTVTLPLGLGGGLLAAATPEIAATAKVLIQACAGNVVLCLNNAGIQVSEAIVPGGVGAGGAVGIGKTAVEATAARAAAANAAKNGQAINNSSSLNVAEQIGILRDAAKGNKGYFGLGKATANEANILGEAWVGPGYRISKDGTSWVSADGLRIYRTPSAKPNSTYATTGVQANFEQKLTPGGRPISNGHLDITK